MPPRTPPKRTARRKGTSRHTLIWERLGERPAAGPAALTTDRIIQIARKLADREGLETLSMRRIAAELGSGVMSLYHYVPSKNDLMDLLLDAAMGEIEVPEKPSGDWRANLYNIANRTRECLKRHPWLLTLLHTRPALGPKRLAQFEASLAAVQELGLDIKTMHRMVVFLYIYVLGFVSMELSEAEALRRQEFNKLPLPYMDRLFATGAFPNFARLVGDGKHPPSADAFFEDGLQFVLEGMAAQMKSSRRS
ncbi:MAG TPA: TetR/AcrR family transcriptional regulator [Bryobacteraceae bacterium]|nr:TetR/AcrR family transcriptional regulator [Bryobacteraceae bacterium]